MAPVQLLDILQTGKNPLVIAIQNTPRFGWDSANLRFYKLFPLLKNTVTFNYADSMKVWEAVQKVKGRPVVLFNTANNGAAELTEWLTRKGVPDVSYLIGGQNLFYEYVSNKQTPGKTDKFFATQSDVRFITPVIYCGMISNKNVQLVDMRHDSLFNKINSGVKHDYKHLTNAANFFAAKGAGEFEKEFTDKKKEYVFISNSLEGLTLADELTKKGYKITWMIGGLDRWEWYINNVEDFKCNSSSLVKQ